MRAAGLWQWARGYAANDDPQIAIANKVALIVAANQPTYPLYVYWTVSEAAWPTLFTFLSTPFFLAVPAVARRWSALGRAMLPVVGMANTVLSAKVFGTASGVELFFVPCVMLAAMLFRRSERWIMLTLIGAALALFLGLHDRYGAPVHLYSLEEYSRFFTVNVASVAILMALLGLLLSNLISDAVERRST